jgi:drug/metabolite transporter (DMT)-like permease
MTPPNSLLKAASAAVLATLMFASMGVAVRYSSTAIPNEMLVFLRNVFGLLFLLPWIYKNGLEKLATRRPGAHIIRALSGLAAMYCFFYAIANLQLAEAVLLNFCSPLFIAIIALLWLGEKVSLQLLSAIFIGFIGICFILKPGTGMFSNAAWVGLASALFAALAMVTIRNLSKSEPTIRIVFYFSITATLVSTIPLSWAWQTPDLKSLIAMIFAGITASIGQLLLTYSYSLAPAANVSPYSYTTVIFATIYGWLFWSETPDIYMYIGAILIVIAGIMAMQRRPMRQLTEPD